MNMYIYMHTPIKSKHGTQKCVLWQMVFLFNGSMLVFGRVWQFVFDASVDVHHYFAPYKSMEFFK